MNLDEAALIPGLRVLPEGKLRGAVDALAAAAALTSKKYPPPSFPLLEGVKWRKELRDYQRAGISFLVRCLNEHGGAILADDMGLGKTLQTIEAIRTLSPRKTLIVCPAAARETWRDELEKWGVKGAVVLSASQTKAAKEDWKRAADARLVVCSYDHRMIARAFEAAFEHELPEMLVLDEAHRIRGRESKRSKELKDSANMARWKLAITATPQYNRPRDFYQLLHTLFGYRFGSQYDFDRRYCGWESRRDGGSGLNTGATNTDELKLRLSFYMLRREKADVAKELPPLTRQVRWVDGTTEATKLYQSVQMGLSSRTIQRALESTLVGKMEEAYQLAEEARRFLLVTWLRAHARQMQRELENRGVPCVCITGDMSTESRAAALKLARSKGWGVVGTLDSMAESLNLQGLASVGIMHAIDYLPLKMAQAEGRLHRLGQTDPVLWYYLAMRDSIDVQIVSKVVNKLDQWRAIMGKKSNRALRDALGDHVDGAGAEQAEAELLRRLYEEM